MSSEENKFFTRFGGDEETPNAEETLRFWQSINNKEVDEGRREDESIQEVLGNVRDELQNGRCRWFAFTEEFEEVLQCTAPWKACGVDSVYSFPIKKCPPIKKAVYQLVKKMVEWRQEERWDEENNWLLEGRTVLIFNGGDLGDPENTPHHMHPTVKKMVTLEINKRTRLWLFGRNERNILEFEQRGVRTSHGCKEAVIENIAVNLKKKQRSPVVELYYDFQKAYDMSIKPFLRSTSTCIDSLPAYRS